MFSSLTGYKSVQCTISSEFRRIELSNTGESQPHKLIHLDTWTLVTGVLAHANSLHMLTVTSRGESSTFGFDDAEEMKRWATGIRGGRATIKQRGSDSPSFPLDCAPEQENGSPGKRRPNPSGVLVLEYTERGSPRLMWESDAQVIRKQRLQHEKLVKAESLDGESDAGGEAPIGTPEPPLTPKQRLAQLSADYLRKPGGSPSYGCVAI